MEDESTASLDGKLLGNMRVVDLKHELEKRGMSKSGSKKDLVKRLKQQLEFEKLCEERKSGAFDPKLELDAEIQQNEFVQQYLAQQQKRYAERQEEKRLESEAGQKCSDKSSAVSSKSEDEHDQSSELDSDETGDEKEIPSCKPSKEISQTDNTSATNVSDEESVEADKKPISTENEKTVEKNSEKNSVIIKVTEIAEEENSIKSNQCKSDYVQTSENKIKSTVVKDPKSLHISLSDSAEKCPKVLKYPDEEKETGSHKIISNDSDDIKKQKEFETKRPSNEIKNLKRDTNESEPFVEGCQMSSSALHSTDSTENGKCDESLKNSSPVSEETRKNISSSFPEEGSSEYLLKQKSSENMETSDCSSVPYSLSDIQLPECPGSHKKSKDSKIAKKSKRETLSDEESDHSKSPDKKTKSNGDTTHKLNSSHEGNMSESETKENNLNDSPKKSDRKQEKETSKRETTPSDESSDVDSDQNSSPYKKKSLKSDDTSSNVAAESEEDQPKTPPSKEKKTVKDHRHTDESDNDKSDQSSDSEKYSRHSDSKRKSSDKQNKRDRHKRSSSSSSSHSSDSSPKRRHPKKSYISKNKDISENSESNQVSDKSSEEKLDKQKLDKHKKDSAIEKHSSVPSVLPKKRLKIKRDNAPFVMSSQTVESDSSRQLEKTHSSKSDEKISSTSNSASENPLKEESTEIKEVKPDVTYKPRKVSLSNRKLNRKTSEDHSFEPKSKKNKWESFASGQKASRTVSISTDSLKNWFPDFKLVSESSMELEQDEPALSAVDEKSADISHSEVSNENEISAKQESTSQIDMEDSESQEPNNEDSSNLGAVSKFIFIQNLVRPFTLNQLTDLLKQNGKIVEEYSWIDKIKSKCFVMYETEKEAIKARNALHNTRWPSSNPKILSVEFSNEEALEQLKKGSELPPVKPAEPPLVEPPEITETRISHPVEEHKRKERERRRDRDRSKPQAPVREWDKDKIMQDSPEREHVSKEEKPRSSEKKEKKESKKRATEDTPAKLLDDLFQKTKTPPCIYWLPLTEEQAKQKEEEKKMRRLERERRNQQLKEQEEAERRSKRARSSRRSREKENRKSSTRSRSPVSRRR